MKKSSGCPEPPPAPDVEGGDAESLFLAAFGGAPFAADLPADSEKRPLRPKVSVGLCTSQRWWWRRNLAGVRIRGVRGADVKSGRWR
jgi:hypothetical protein